jgi:hypothetical protein
LAQGHLEQPPPLVEPLEPKQSRVDQPPLRSRLDLLPNRIGHEDLPAGGLSRNAGGDVYRLSVQLTVALADLSDVDAYANPDLALGVGGVVLVMRTLDADGAADRGHR